MVRLLLLASLLVGCRVSLENEPEIIVDRNCTPNGPGATCAAAAGKSDYAWIQTNVFDIGCNSGGSCHGAVDPEGVIDLRSPQSYENLVNATAGLDPTRKLVVPNDLQSSYLMLMLGGVTPDMATPPASPPPGGYMPRGVPGGLCCQKMDAIERWIMEGAQNN